MWFKIPALLHNDPDRAQLINFLISHGLVFIVQFKFWRSTKWRLMSKNLLPSLFLAFAKTRDPRPFATDHPSGLLLLSFWWQPERFTLRQGTSGASWGYVQWRDDWDGTRNLQLMEEIGIYIICEQSTKARIKISNSEHVGKLKRERGFSSWPRNYHRSSLCVCVSLSVAFQRSVL